MHIGDAMENLQLEEEFDAVKANDELQGVPPGRYKVLVQEAKSKNSNNGTRITVPLLITEGDQQGRYIYESFFSLADKNVNEVSKSIAKRTFARLCIAAGIEKAKSMDDCKGHTVVVTTARQKKNPQYTEVTRVENSEDALINSDDAPNW